ncbi:MAG TPA: hypothetical protein VJS88_02370 [Chthoniobacterales bacterium]|nr:hypothetical protein [Chthoniobacterales bacterium]
MKSPPASRSELDEVVVNIELTLASIVQGVALTFLAENAGEVVSHGPVTAWPYVAVSFLIILLFWARAAIHTLTLIRWPLEFLHNFFYFGCALVEVLAFRQINNPFMWFALNTGFAALVWALFLHDLRIIRQRTKDSVGESSFRLYAIVLADQWNNIRFVVPAVFLFSLGSAVAVKMAPEFFVERHGHLLLVALQGIGLAVNLGYIIRSFSRITPLISAARAEWRDDVEEGV